MKTKRGKSGTGLRDYVKKSDSEEKMIKVINKQGEAVFEKKSKVKANPNDYKPAEGSPFKKAIKEIMEKREPGGRFSRADIELAKNMLKKRTGGAMLKNPGKADLDKDGKLSGYEKKRGMAIEKAMGAKRGKFAKTKRQNFGSAEADRKEKKDEFTTYNKMRDMMDTQRKMQQRKKDMEKDKQKILEKKKGIAVKSGGMMKYNKGGGADTGRVGELKSKIAVATDKIKKHFQKRKKRPDYIKPPERKPMIPAKAAELARTAESFTPTGMGKKIAKKLTGKMGGGMMKKYNKGGGADTGKMGELKSKLAVGSDKMKRINEMLKKIGQRKPPKRPKLQAPERGPMKPLKAKEGKAVKNDPRTRDERVKKAFPKKSPRGRAVISTIGSQNPMKRDRLFEGAKARRRKMFTDALRGLGKVGRSLTPAGAAGPIARKIGEGISKNFSKKMGGGMMMKPMGYKSGTSVMARGCKLGRKKATKIM